MQALHYLKDPPLYKDIAYDETWLEKYKTFKDNQQEVEYVVDENEKSNEEMEVDDYCCIHITYTCT